MRKLSLLFICFAVLSSCTHSARRPSAASPLESLSASDREVYAKLLGDSLRFFDRELRHAGSGQYHDAISLKDGDSPDFNSSVASTGMGLIALALGDATGVIGDAREKVEQTLVFALGEGRVDGRPYLSKRSRDGWFRHWFDLRDGRDNKASAADGYSTIDTAILVAGAQLAANYFASTGRDPEGILKQLADRVLFSVRWETAIADADRGRLTLTFDLRNESARGQTAVFNEYILVACMGHAAESRRGQSGAMTAFWNKHYRRTEKILKKDFDGIPQLTDHPGHYLSSFAIQFATYLCSDVSGSPEYLQAMSDMQRADRKAFAAFSPRPYLWGSGAGEVRIREGGTIKSSYHADNLTENPGAIASPHIVAGFLPVHPEGLADLLEMRRRQECFYRFKEYGILWRCNVHDPSLAIDRLQSIDYSSMMLGLSAIHPRVGGLDFFRRFAAGAGD